MLIESLLECHLYVCAIFITYYVTGSMFRSRDIRMNKTLVKVEAGPHANRPVQGDVVSGLLVFMVFMP